MLLKYIYMVFLGILIAIFVGAGVSVFYPQPSEPEYPITLQYTDKELTAEQKQIQTEYEAQRIVWLDEFETYNRNVSIIALIAAIVLLAASLLIDGHAKVIADGVMLGGVFTLLYSLGRGFASNNNKYSFLVASIGLIIAIALGFKRFVEPREKSTANAKA